MSTALINFLIVIKNASLLKKERLNFYFNKKYIALAKTLYKAGLIQDFWLDSLPKAKVVISLKYSYDVSPLNSIKIVSKPSKSLFFSSKDIFKLYEKNLIYMFSTSVGHLSSAECKQRKLGGVLFFYAK